MKMTKMKNDEKKFFLLFSRSKKRQIFLDQLTMLTSPCFIGLGVARSSDTLCCPIFPTQSFKRLK